MSAQDIVGAVFAVVALLLPIGSLAALLPIAAERARRKRAVQHDPRCISLTDSQFNTLCDCKTLHMIDSWGEQ